MNENFINTWVENAELGRTGSLQDPIAKRREREGITYNTKHPLAKAIMKGWVKGSPVDCFVISHDFELMGSVDFNEFLDNMQKPEDEPNMYMEFLKNSLNGKRPGLGDTILTPEQPTQNVIDTFRTPEIVHQDYAVVFIDTTAFKDGGTLTIDIHVGKDNAIGIFQLLDGDKKLPTEKVPDGVDPEAWNNQDSEEYMKPFDALAKVWGIFPGQTGKITYQFDQGKLFKLCATGDQWGGIGAINAFHATVSVETNYGKGESMSETIDQNDNASKPISLPINVLLNKKQPDKEILDIFRTPEYGYQDYMVINIDTTAFESGGILSIDIKVGNAEPSGSFDLFDGDSKMPTEGISTEALASAWDIPPEKTGTIQYHFDVGKRFKLGATGNWFSEKYSINAFRAKISVKEVE